MLHYICRSRVNAGTTLNSENHAAGPRGLGPLRVGLRFLRFHGARSSAAGGAAGKRQQRDVARALDGHAQPALVTGADAGHAARQDLAALLHELRKNVGTLVIDQVHLFDTELADFLLAEKLALSARTPAGTARAAFAASAAGSAFATGTGMTALRTRSRRRSLRRGRRCGYLILFVCHNVYPFSCQGL